MEREPSTVVDALPGGLVVTTKSSMTPVVKPRGSTSPAVVTGEIMSRTADKPCGNLHDTCSEYTSSWQLQDADIPSDAVA